LLLITARPSNRLRICHRGRYATAGHEGNSGTSTNKKS
jgi:hypothetical protein